MGWFDRPRVDLDARRRRMLRMDLAGRDIDDARVLDAMAAVPRERFVPDATRDKAYDDHALPIGHAQTISQPYIVALTCQLARVGPSDRVLDVGTGSGYQAAVLCHLAQEVFSMEIVAELAEDARARLRSMRLPAPIHLRHGDARDGWPEAAPFDVIVSAAAPEEVPPALFDQLGPGGRLVCPVGAWRQRLMLFERAADGGLVPSDCGGVRFVPLTGGA